MTKKEIYNNSVLDLRTHICDETAIKPYYYMCNGLLHVRYTVDRCVELTPAEITKLKVDITANPEKKQTILEEMWNFLTLSVERKIIHDGIAEMERRIKEYASKEEQNG
jgi:hypothetical protein